MFERWYLLNFFIFYEELLDVAMWQNLPMGCWAQSKKISFFYHKILDFTHFYLIFLLIVVYKVIFSMIV